MGSGNAEVSTNNGCARRRRIIDKRYSAHAREREREIERERGKGEAILNGYASSAVLSDNASGR